MQGQTIQCTCVRHQVGSLPNCQIAPKQSMTLTLTLAGIDGVGKKGVDGWCAKTIANHFYICSQKFTAKWCEHIVQLLIFSSRPQQPQVFCTRSLFWHTDHYILQVVVLDNFCKFMYHMTFIASCLIPDHKFCKLWYSIKLLQFSHRITFLQVVTFSPFQSLFGPFLTLFDAKTPSSLAVESQSGEWGARVNSANFPIFLGQIFSLVERLPYIL